MCAFVGGNGAGWRVYVENSTTKQRDHGNQLTKKKKRKFMIDMFSQLFWCCQ